MHVKLRNVHCKLCWFFKGSQAMSGVKINAAQDIGTLYFRRVARSWSWPGELLSLIQRVPVSRSIQSTEVWKGRFENCGGRISPDSLSRSGGNTSIIGKYRFREKNMQFWAAFPFMKTPNSNSGSSKAHPMRPILHLLWQISAGIHRFNWPVERSKFVPALTNSSPPKLITKPKTHE